MPAEIVTETCPAPECNLTEQDIEQFLEEMTGYIEMFEPAFQRAEQLERSKAYLRACWGIRRARMWNGWRWTGVIKPAACSTLSVKVRGSQSP